MFRELLPFLTSRAPPLEMKGRVYASCVRSSMTYGSETRPLLVDVGLKFERAEMQMIKYLCDLIRLNVKSTTIHKRACFDPCLLCVPPIGKTCANSYFDRSFVYAAPTLWNALELDYCPLILSKKVSRHIFI